MALYRRFATSIISKEVQNSKSKFRIKCEHVNFFGFFQCASDFEHQRFFIFRWNSFRTMWEILWTCEWFMQEICEQNLSLYATGKIYVMYISISFYRFSLKNSSYNVLTTRFQKNLSNKDNSTMPIALWNIFCPVQSFRAADPNIKHIPTS